MIKSCNDKNNLSPSSCKDTNKNCNSFKIRGLVTAQSKQVYRPHTETKEGIQSCQFYSLVKPGKPQTTLADEEIMAITKIVKGKV